METTTKTTHPLILVAAGAVTVASLAAAAHFTGLLGNKSEPTPAQLASAPAAVAQAPNQTATAAKPETVVTVPKGSTVTIATEGEKQAAAKPRPQPRASEPTYRSRPVETADRSDDNYRRVSSNGDAGVDVIPSGRTYRTQSGAASPSICRDCGTVESVREITTKGEGSGLGAVAGGVLGGVLGNQVGNGKGRDAATVVGAIGGAVAGHHIEKNVRSEKQYQVSVRFDDGSYRTYTLTNPQWRSGDRVRLSNGGLASL